MERMQALKLIEKTRSIAPRIFPIAFARSLVAIANHKEDVFRKISIEALRSLSMVNPALVASVDGFIPLLDAIIEPINPSMADSILLTILYLLNDPYTRHLVSGSIDLRVLISPFTDLDSSSNELAVKWNASRSAIVLAMRTWVGLIHLTSDHMGWATLVRMLRDPKVPMPTQEIILDMITEIFEPITQKIKKVNRTYRHQQQVWSIAEEQTLTAIHLVPSDSALAASVNNDNNNRNNNNNQRSSSSSPSSQSTCSDIGSPTPSNAIAKNNSVSQIYAGQSNASIIASNNTTSRSSISTPTHQKRGSINKELMKNTINSLFHLSSSSNKELFTTTSTNNNNNNNSNNNITASSTSSNSSSSTSNGEVIKKNSSANSFMKQIFSTSSSSSSAAAASIISSNNNNNTKQNNNRSSMSSFEQDLINTSHPSSSNNTTTSTSTPPPFKKSNSLSKIETVTSNSSTSQQTVAPTMVQSSSASSFQSTIKRRSGGDHSTYATTTLESDFKIFKGKKFNYKDKHVIDRSISPCLASASNNDAKVESLRLAGYFNEHEALIDPIFNLMDNYSALLCCAFLHVNLIQSLYFLGKKCHK